VSYTGLIDQYRERLPLAAGVRAVALCEGRTPLIRLDHVARDAGFEGELYVKFEGLNPTGSFKDRGMTVAVTQAVHEGARAIICASTGNTSAAAAAYAARAGITAFVLIPEGKIALGKLAQAIVHGAVVVQIEGNFDDGMRLVKELGQTTPVAIVNSVNPYRLQGQKTAAFEIVEALGRAPDYHCLPVGNAGNISAYWMGYSEVSGQKTSASMDGYALTATATRRPKMCGYQAAGAAPFLRGAPVKNPETVATAIRIGDPQSWQHAWNAQKDSGGWFAEFSDEQILATQKMLAAREGIWCEPASATSLCGALADIQAGRIAQGSTVVCTLTGVGLKDPDVVTRDGLKDLIRLPAERAAIEKALLARM
jgi:threonine synthase